MPTPYMVPTASSATQAGIPASSRAILRAWASGGLKKVATVTVGSD